MTSNFSFSNVATDTDMVISCTDIKPKTTYAKKSESATSCVLTNKTCTLDTPELLSYQCTEIAKVNTQNRIINPAKVSSGVQYIVRLDEILRTTDTNGSIICDEPIVASLTVRHPISGNITNAEVVSVIKRLLGACMREDGTYRFDDLMRSALQPIED